MQLQRAATNRYIQRGFITSHIGLPPQDLTHGTLALTASEGRVESITLGGDRPLMLNSAFSQHINLMRHRALTQQVYKPTLKH